MVLGEGGERAMWARWFTKKQLSFTESNRSAIRYKENQIQEGSQNVSTTGRYGYAEKPPVDES